MNQSSDNCQPALERNTRPNHPPSRPPVLPPPAPSPTNFPKILREPRECATLLLTTAIRARGPAATRHLATHENRLPILRMSPQPCRAHSHPPCPAFQHPSAVRTSAKALFPYVSDRLRSSQIVWERLRSPRIVRTHRRPPTAIPAELPQCSPNAARQTGKKARQSASKRVFSRRFASKYARQRP